MGQASSLHRQAAQATSYNPFMISMQVAELEFAANFFDYAVPQQDFNLHLLDQVVSLAD